MLLLFLLSFIFSSCSFYRYSPKLHFEFEFFSDLRKKTENIKPELRKFEWSTPVFLHNYVIFATKSGVITKTRIDNQIGFNEWSQDIKSPILGTPALIEKRGKIHIIVPAIDGFVYVIDFHNGRIIWKFKSYIPIISRVSVFGDLILIQDIQDRICAFSAADISVSDQPNWCRDFQKSKGLTLFGTSSPAQINGNIVAGFSDGNIVSIDPNGDILWFYDVSHFEENFTDIDHLSTDEENIYFTSPSHFFKMNKDGKILWKRKIKFPKGIAVFGDGIVLSSLDGVEAYSKSGAVLWKQRFDKYGNVVRISEPKIFTDYVIVVVETGGKLSKHLGGVSNIFALSLNTGKVVRYISSPFSYHLSIYKNTLALLSVDTVAYIFSLKIY